MAKTTHPIKTRIKFDLSKIRKCVLILRALNHKLRQRILDLLEEHDALTVTDIYVKLRLEQSVASQHLAILRKAGVVATERSGKFIYYRLDRDEMKRINTFITGLVG
jgi:DNA-binding transcriptional ArsR family regulator